MHHSFWNTPKGCSAEQYKTCSSCLTPLLDRGDLLDLNMLDVARKDPHDSEHLQKGSHNHYPEWKSWLSVPTPSEPTTPEPEEAAHNQRNLP